MIPTQKKRNHKHAYLAVFDNQKWVPICYGTQKGKVCYFNEIGKDIAYLPLYYDNQGIHPITDPFILDSRGRIKYLHVNERKLYYLGNTISQNIFSIMQKLSPEDILKLPIIRISPILIQYIRFLIGYCPQILSR